MEGPPIISGMLRKNVITMMILALVPGIVCAELYRRYHTIPHIQRRTEYYRRLGVEFKSII